MADATAIKPEGESIAAIQDTKTGQSVRVRASARLHMGFLDLNFGLGRRFGSIGLSLDAPATDLTLRRAAHTHVQGPESERAARYLSTLAAHLRLEGGHVLTIESAIPPHAGLGSGTQLALSVVTALRRLHRLAPDLRGDAHRLGRGGRSGIGIGLFRRGGLVVDGGSGARDAPPPLLARLAVPAAWRVLLLADPARQGLAGAQESAAFAALRPLPDTAAAHVCRLVLMQALPALAEADLPGFGAAITAIQEIVGDHFAPAQGGRFTSPRVAAALAWLWAEGAVGLGQSSWGPTGFAFAPDEATGRRLRAALVGHETGKGLDVTLCRALNRGASVTVT